MKNKKLTYILIPAVIIIWGAIAFKIIGSLKKTDSGSNLSLQSAMNVKTDTSDIRFTLIADYRDPFLSVQKRTPVVSNTTTIQQPKPTRSIQRRSIARRSRVRWPAVEYGGVIRNKKSSSLTGLVKINNNDYLMSEGMIIEEIELLKIYEDSIQLKYNDETKGFPKIK